jgi:prepilin-type N-terminal cleavage/methylation domain-containing protein
MKARRAGFTLVELLVVVLILSILVRIALPSYRQITLRASAAAIMGDISVVRHAAFNYFADHGHWPPDVNRGVTPPGLVPYLPDGFTFRGEGYNLDWDNWTLPDGTPKHSGVKVLVGISVATTNPALGEAFLAVLGGAAAHTLGEHYTYVILAAQ